MQDSQPTINGTTKRTPRMTIRVSRGSLAFAMANATQPERIHFEPYIAKSGMSVAANLREAFKLTDILQRPTHRAQILIDTPPLMVPMEEYDEQQAEALYMHCFPSTEGSTIVSNVLPDLNAVCLFAVNKDLKLVVDDHYADARFITLMRPVWQYMHKRSFIGNRRKLYAHFHDGKMDAFSFERNRFVFCNQYRLKEWKDAVFFLLYIWKQLAMDQTKDELYISGDAPERKPMTDALREYVAKVTVINPAADFNRAPITAIKGIPFDLVALYLS